MNNRKWDFEGRCVECNKKVNILIDRTSSNSMTLRSDECIDHPGKSHILWPQRDDIIQEKGKDRKIVSMIEYKDCIFVATQKGVYKIGNNEITRLEFIEV